MPSNVFQLPIEQKSGTIEQDTYNLSFLPMDKTSILTGRQRRDLRRRYVSILKNIK